MYYGPQSIVLQEYDINSEKTCASVNQYTKMTLHNTAIKTSPNFMQLTHTVGTRNTMQSKRLTTSDSITLTDTFTTGKS